MRCYQEEKTEKTTRIGIISYAVWSGITCSESVERSSTKSTRTIGVHWRFENLLRSWLTEQLWQYHVPHQALITSSSRKPSRESRMQRNTRDDMSAPGNVFDCQHSRWDPDELHNDSRNLATLSSEGIEKSESEEPLQSIPISCFSVRAREKSLDGGKCPVSMTNDAAGSGTCTQSGMTLPRKCICQNSLTKQNFTVE